MNERSRTGLEILQASLLIGVLGNLLLRQTPWGLNAFLFVGAFVAAMLMLMRRRRPELLTKTTLALSGAMVFFASMFLIRDAEELLVFDTIAILVVMGVMLLVNVDVKAHIAGVFHYAAGFIWSGITSVFGPIALLVADVEWNQMPGNKYTRHLFSVLRGLAVALPLVLIFGGLFMAADAAFEGLVNRAVNFEIDTVISHVVITSLLAWLTAGYFRGAMGPTVGSLFAGVSTAASTGQAEKTDDAGGSVVAKIVEEPGENAARLPDNASVVEHINRSDPPEADDTPKKGRDWQNFDNSSVPSVFTLGTIETVIILGLIDLLFLAFVIIQVPYLFGGMDLVQTTPDFKLAEYARRGFGELVAVSALVLPMLLVSHWLVRRDGSGAERSFKILAGVQIGLLFVIMASAMQRLILLTGALGYGMTTVRFYPMVVMIWLAVVFIWFTMTVLRGSRSRFAWGALWSAIVILAATNMLNPHAFIARHNVNLMQQGREFDARYISRLSVDAVPVLVGALPDLSGDDVCRVKSGLQAKLDEVAAANDDMRSWNYSRSDAESLLQQNHSRIDEPSRCHDYMLPAHPRHHADIE